MNIFSEWFNCWDSKKVSFEVCNLQIYQNNLVNFQLLVIFFVKGLIYFFLNVQEYDYSYSLLSWHKKLFGPGFL